MDDFTIMTVLHTQTHLRKPVQDLGLAEIAPSLLLQLARQVTAICIVHNDAQLTFLGFEYFNELDNIWMLQMFNNLGFLQSLPLLCFPHSLNVNCFHDTHELIRHTLDQIGLTKGSLAQQFDLPVLLEFLLLFKMIHLRIGW